MNHSMSDVSVEQAKDFLSHVIAREDARLGDLARWMNSTGGPIQFMDASLGSLVPLWEWFISFARSGCPGVPVNSWPAESIAFGRHEGVSAGLGRPYYAAEALEHYLLKVVQRVHPDAKWDVHIQGPSRVLDAHRNQTGIRYGNNDFRQVDIPISVTVRRMLADTPSALDPARLERLTLMTFGWEQKRPVQSSASSILAPYLTTPEVPLDDPRRQPPVFHIAPAARVETPAPSFGEELVFASIGADLESLESAPPLDAGSVATVLTEIGFAAPDGSAVSPESLTAAEQQQFEYGEVAMIQTFAPGGRLAGFMLEPTGASQAEWNTIVASLNGLGLKIGARLAREGEF